MAEALRKPAVKAAIVKSLNDAFEDAPTEIDEATNLQDLAADSLKIVLIASLIEEELDIELDPAVLYSATSVDLLADDIIAFVDQAY
jgi:acyl carrier protein